MNDSTPETQWYIARDGKQHGPISDAEMRAFIEGGYLKEGDLVWRPGFSDWQPAEGVFPPAPAAAALTSMATNDAKPADARGAAEGSQTRSDDDTADEPTVGEPGSRERGADQSTVAASARHAEPTPKRAGGRGSASEATAGRAATSPGTSNFGRSSTQSAASSAPARDRAANPVVAVDAVDETFDAPRRGGFGKRIGIALAVLIVLGGVGFAAYQNRDLVSQTFAGTDPGDAVTPVVKAGGETKVAAAPAASAVPAPEPASPRAPVEPAPADAAPAAPSGGQMVIPGIVTTLPPIGPARPAPPQTTAALQTPAAPSAAAPGTAAPGVSPQVVDQSFQKSPLWALMKREFPEWYGARIDEVAQMSGARTETDVSRHLVGELVALRRRNAEHALAANTDRLRSIAAAFLANLKLLSGHSTAACYTFISQGESSPDVVALFREKSYGPSIEAQITAVFEAVADGRKAPITRTRAQKAEYDVLAQQLQAMGWSRADLKLFASPDELAKAPREQVCKMVQDWFAAHIAISDKGVQERLLFETLRPVVAG
ncbi:MAG: DUF4339 domain-containing protein [Hyphomicrobiaceae bacterium]|nr:DUF4339 domain-containing protein [Hyphomicrobiaceae bacterium]